MLRSLPLNKELAHRRFFPQKFESQRHFDLFVNTAVIDNLAPAAPFISRDTQIVTMGSCFAQNIARNLRERNYRVHNFDIQERLFTPFALRAFIDGLGAEEMDFSLFQDRWRLAEDQIAGLRVTLSEDAVIIITLGLSVVWVDVTTQEVILDPGRTVGKTILYDNPERYQMRPTTVPENLDAINGIISALRRLKHSNKIIFTLSPNPLVSCPGDYPIIIADAISKSVLRVALHGIMEARDPSIYYYPSFELLKWLAPMVDQIWFEDGVTTHVRKDWVDYTLSKFMRAYCLDETSLPPPVQKFAGNE